MQYFLCSIFIIAGISHLMAATDSQNPHIHNNHDSVDGYDLEPQYDDQSEGSAYSDTFTHDAEVPFNNSISSSRLSSIRRRHAYRPISPMNSTPATDVTLNSHTLPDKNDKQETKTQPVSVVLTKDMDQYISVLRAEQLRNQAKHTSPIEKYKRKEYQPDQRSLVIVFDATGSMVNDLDQLRQGAVDIVTSTDQNPIYNYIYVPFRDPDIGPKLITTDQDELLAALNDTKLWGGGDCPESAVGGLISALESALPKSFVYVFTDAIAKDFALEGRVLSLVQKKQTPVTFLLTGFCNDTKSPGFRVFQNIASASNGQIFDLKKQNVFDALEVIKSSWDLKRVPLHYLHSDGAEKHQIDVTVDEHIKEFRVSVAGDNPNITIIDPKLQPYESGNELLTLDRLKVVNVEDPTPGKWNVQAASDSSHSVQLSAISDVLFKFGFSIQHPENIDEISYKPLRYTPNIISIIPSNSSVIANLTQITISMDEDKSKNASALSFQLPLHRATMKTDTIFVTKPFEPPLNRFKITIHGYDNEGHPLQRLLSTEIRSSDESGPEVTIEPIHVDVLSHTSVALKCSVISHHPATIEWKFKNTLLERLEANQSSSLVLSIENARPKDTGKYICYAVNKIDSQKADVYVRVRTRPVAVAIPDNNYTTVEDTRKFEIPCAVTPNLDAVQVEWMFNATPLTGNPFIQHHMKDSNIILENVNRSYSGLFTCFAKLDEVEAKSTTHLHVHYPVRIMETRDAVVSVAWNESATIDCSFDGNPLPTIVWTFNDTVLAETEGGELPLLIEQMAESKEGEYKCTAFNQIHEPATKTVMVRGIANEPPSIQRNPTSSVVYVQEGDDLAIACKCSMCMPLTNFRWSTDNAIADSNFVAINEPFLPSSSFQLTLQLKNATTSNAAVYTCYLENTDGFDELTVDVRVLTPPVIEKVVASNSTKIDTDNINIIEGGSTYIKCAAKGMPIPVIQWIKDGSPVLVTDRVYAENQSLVVADARTADAGVYECRAINPLGMITKNFTLLVVVPPKISTQNSSLQQALEGEHIILPCEIHAIPPPQITWLLNGHEINMSDHKFTTPENMKLSFRADASDTGIYECQATNEGGTATQELVLLIFVDPVIYPANDEIITVKSNTDIVLKCDATGFPSPEIKWSFNGVHIDIDNSTDIVLQESGSVELTNITNLNQGTYVCDASNGVGITQKVFYLTINDPPKVISTFENEYKILPHDNFVLGCDAIGNPFPTIRWLKNGQVLSSTNVLAINESDERDSGVYRCEASNTEGVDFKNITIQFIEKPKLLTELTDHNHTMSQGSHLELSCPFSNFDQIIWMKDNELLKKHTAAKLILANVDQADGGVYICEVQNEAGTDNFTFAVNVLSAPLIELNGEVLDNYLDTKEVSEVMVKLGETFSIECIVRGNPKPMVDWHKNDMVFVKGDKLIIDKVEIHDSGLYSCVAKNSQGSTERSYRMEVIAPPGIYDTNKILLAHYEIEAGDTITLECPLNGNPPPRVHWFQNEKPMDEFQEIIDIKPSKSADLKCVGDNSFGQESFTFHVTVFQPAKIINTTEDTSAIGGHEMKLLCVATGVPTPIVTWTHDGKIIGTTAKIHFNADYRKERIYMDAAGNGFTAANPLYDALDKMEIYVAASITSAVTHDTVMLEMIFPKARIRHAGDYVCVAINSIGRAKTRATVTVLVPPSINLKHVKQRQSHEILEGLPFILHCDVNGFPIPTIKWLKKISENNYQRIPHNSSKEIGNQKQLIFTSSDQSNNGTYMCEARNSAGNISMVYDVHILVPPVLLSKRIGRIQTRGSLNPHLELMVDDEDLNESSDLIDRLSVAPDEPIDITCPIVNTERTDIVWHRVNAFGTGERTLLTETNQILNVPSAHDSVIYVCTVSTPYGSMEHTFHVTVEKPPRLDGANYNYSIDVQLYKSFTLKCFVSGQPEPKITWFKEETPLSNQNITNYFLSTGGKVLHVSPSRKTDSGRFSCVAENKLGHTRSFFDVNVYTPVGWSAWGPWSECTKTCGPGYRTRIRICIFPNGQPVDFESTDDVRERCEGAFSETEPCQMIPCPVDGGWGVWTKWSPCTPQCIIDGDQQNHHDPIRSRSHQCDSPEPAFGGRPCPGSSTQIEQCGVPFCKIDGGWSKWSPWSACSVTCGQGSEMRTRLCNQPIPKYGGRVCDGERIETSPCAAPACPVDGGWSDWTPWSRCSRTCGVGARQRKRFCNNPEPIRGGRPCEGENVSVNQCHMPPCSNRHLLKSIESKRPRDERIIGNFKPLYTYDKPQNQLLVDAIDEVAEHNSAESNSNRQLAFFESPSVEYVLPDRRERVVSQLKSPANSMKNSSHKVTVTVVNTIPLTADIAEINFHAGPPKRDDPALKSCRSGFAYNNATSECDDIDECSRHVGICDESQVCENVAGSYRCNCLRGLMPLANGEYCADIDECLSGAHNCSHFCKNTKGSYNCECPPSMLLSADLQTCRQVSRTNRLQRDQPFNYDSETVCPDGYVLVDEKCDDIDECLAMEDDCGIDQTCMNTQGSYMCVPTACPDDYNRDNRSGRCIKLCHQLTNDCPGEPTLRAKILGHIILSILSPSSSNPILRIRNYDLDNHSIPNGRFTFAENSLRDIFHVENVIDRHGATVGHLYAKKNFRREKLYKLIIIGHSYDDRTKDLTYLSKYIIYVYGL